MGRGRVPHAVEAAEAARPDPVRGGPIAPLNDIIAKIVPPGAFASDPVDDETVAALFGAARVAPSADNVQMWRFVTVRDAARKAAIIEGLPENRRALFSSAPLVVAAMAEPWFVKGSRREQPFFMIDVPIAISHIALQAAEIGLACAVEYGIDEETVKMAVRAGPAHRAVAVLGLGRNKEAA